jgi:hypothetical protein
MAARDNQQVVSLKEITLSPTHTPPLTLPFVAIPVVRSSAAGIRMASGEGDMGYGAGSAELFERVVKRSTISPAAPEKKKAWTADQSKRERELRGYVRDVQHRMNAYQVYRSLEAQLAR